MTFVNVDSSPVLLWARDMASGPLLPIPSLAGREAQGGEVAESSVLGLVLSLVRCSFAPVLLSAWASDVSAAK